MAKGMSAARVSRRALPLSQVSARAKTSRLASITSAILRSMLLRSVAEELFQDGAAAQAASSANSMSSAVERGMRVKALPSTGETFSKYCPMVGATHLPPMKFSY